MNPKGELIKTLINAVKKTGDMLKHELYSGDYCFIENSSTESSGLHTRSDKLANDFLLELLLPDLCSILKTDVLLIISEENEEKLQYTASSKSFILAGDNSRYTGFVLVMDPICGSIPYARSLPDYVVAVAIVKDLQCIASVVYQPSLNELFYADLGKGAFFNNVPLEAPSKICDLEHSIISIEHRVYKVAPTEDIQEIAKRSMRIRTAGTCALEMCYVACGRLDGLIKLNQAFYDYLPGALIMQEAGLQTALVALDGVTPIIPLKALNEKVSFLATNGMITHQLAYYTQSWETGY